jgi:hypothetical protein
MASSTAYQGAYSTHLQERRQVRRLRWRELRPWFGNVGYSQPYLVLDLGQFTARCRWCLWQSAPCGALDEAQFAYGLHTCPAGQVAASGVLGVEAEVIGRRMVGDRCPEPPRPGFWSEYCAEEPADQPGGGARTGGEVEVL